MNSLTDKLRAGRDLNRAEISRAVVQLLATDMPGDAKAEFLTALHRKGETAEEIAGFVEQLIDRAIDPLVRQEDVPGPMIDVCGTAAPASTSTTSRPQSCSSSPPAVHAW